MFDVSNPAAPVLRSTLSPPTDNYWNGVWAKGNALYVASADSGVIVFDISEPATPRLVRQVPSRQGALDVHTVFVEGDRLYAMSPSPGPGRSSSTSVNPRNRCCSVSTWSRRPLASLRAFPTTRWPWRGGCISITGPRVTSSWT
ncbi:LVIVD repeat-containing protein [Cystobacter fuscus]